MSSGTHVLCRFVYSPCLIILSLGNMCGSNSYMQKCFLVPFYVHLVLFLILVLVTFVHSLLSIYILMFTVSISFIFNVAACMFIFFFLSVSSSCYPYGTVFCCFLFCGEYLGKKKKEEGVRKVNLIRGLKLAPALEILCVYGFLLVQF